MNAVVKLGGFAFPSELKPEPIASYAKLFGRFAKKNQLAIITGGGEEARRYIAAARRLGASEGFCDQLGIHLTRANAQLLIAALGEKAFPQVPDTMEDLRKFFAHRRIVVMGGLQPGQSTNAVAAVVAESLGADILVNATDVAGVYTSNPTTDPSARMYSEISTQELERILAGQGSLAGGYDLMDMVAIQVIARSRIPTWIVDGRNPANIEKALKKGRVGTRIVHRG